MAVTGASPLSRCVYQGQEPYVSDIADRGCGPGQSVNSIYVSGVMWSRTRFGQRSSLSFPFQRRWWLPGRKWQSIRCNNILKKIDLREWPVGKDGTVYANLDALPGQERIGRRFLSDSPLHVFEVQRRGEYMVFASGDSDRRDAD